MFTLAVFRTFLDPSRRFVLKIDCVVVGGFAVRSQSVSQSGTLKCCCSDQGALAKCRFSAEQFKSAGTVAVHGMTVIRTQCELLCAGCLEAKEDSCWCFVKH